MPIPLRSDFDAAALRGLARKAKDAPQARRLLALAAIWSLSGGGGADRRGHAPDRAGLGGAVQRTRP